MKHHHVTIAAKNLVALLAILSSHQLLAPSLAFSISGSRSSSSSSRTSYSSTSRRLLLLPLPTFHEKKSFLQQPPTAGLHSATTPMLTTRYASSTTTNQPQPLLLRMSVEGDFDPDALSQARDKAQSGSVKARLRALYKFTRPHTIRGTVLASVAGTIRALRDTPGAIAQANIWSVMLPRALVGMVALLLGNVFIVGINQIYDQDIDKMNKPFLPVASGEMSKRNAWIAVMSSVVAGPWLVHKFYPPLLFYLYSTGIFLGAIYSIPPIRTKKNPVLAGLTIATVRGFLLNFGIYYAVKDAVGSSFRWSPKVAFIARFMTLFASVIAITKDLPDIEGDKAYQIETFATKVGVPRIAKGATVFLFLNYVHAVATGILSLRNNNNAFNAIPMIGGHVALAMLLLARYLKLDPNSMPSVKLYYKHIWDLFYLEYVLYTLI